MNDELGIDWVAREEAQRAAAARCGQGGVRVKSQPNLTAKIALNLKCEREHRQPTPQEIALCDDLTVEPLNPGAGQ